MDIKLGTLLRAASRVVMLGGSDDHIKQVCEENGWDPAQLLGGGAVAAGPSGQPRDLAKLKEFVAEGDWNVARRGRPPAFRKNRDGSEARPGYCQGSKTGSCGDDFPSHDTPYAYRKQDQPGGAATVCLGCFEAAGGVDSYVPKQQPQDTAPVVADNEDLPF